MDVFPGNFFFGAATSSHQIEGGNHNDWSVWEKKNAERLARESEKEFQRNPNWQKFKTEAEDPQNYISGRACDSWHRYEEDFNILRSLGLNAYRFSLEWSRIEPQEGKWDESAIAHYAAMLRALRARNIEPFLTLWHWTLPLWLAERGGTLAGDFPEKFARYADKAAESFPDVRFWITLNEPDVQTSHAYLKGQWPPQKKSIWLAWQAIGNLVRAHKAAYRAIKKRLPQAEIGVAKHQIYFEMARPSLLNHLLKSAADYVWNFYFLNRIRNSQDFIGLNHYNRNVIRNGFNKNPNALQTDFGWEYHPDSIYGALTELRRYHKPIYITENGIADASDELRQKFIPAALSAVRRAMAAGADVRGYFYWSLLDNFEWDKGFWPRFGLAAMDYKTMERKIRPSAYAYKALIKEEFKN